MLRLAFIGVVKTTIIMNFNFLIISIISRIITSGFVGSAFAFTMEKIEFSQEEIAEMKLKAVLINMHDQQFTIELFPEVAPNHVYHFLKLVESGYYDGMVFHRIIPKFMIQTGDPNTKDPETDRSLWGTGGPGYVLEQEFNTLQHDRGCKKNCWTATPYFYPLWRDRCQLKTDHRFDSTAKNTKRI